MHAYDPITARHYSAYRPDLHKRILEACIDSTDRYGMGLDVGCGTGQSAIALAHFCRHVMALDTSGDMIREAIPHPNVAYHHSEKNKIDAENDLFNIITIAGSWYYAKSQQLLDEMIRVSKQSAPIILYDFDVDLKTVLKALRPGTETTESAYNHQEDFSGLDTAGIKNIHHSQYSTTIHVKPSDLAHLLLSEKAVYLRLSKQFGHDQILKKVSMALSQISNGATHELDVQTYTSVYANIK